jgi:hypothetical protein
MMELGRNTLMLQYCWVCELRFKNSIPAGPANREDHHIFPRNAGGDDGPLVSLCSEHHTCLHKVANRLHSKKRFDELMVGETKTQAQKLLWLAAQVVKAERLVADDPNKLLSNSLQLTQDETAMVVRLQKMTGKTRSEVLRAGLRVLYRQYFND